MKNKLVIITGASSGIGATTAKSFSKAGYPLALLARNLEAMEKLNLPNTICISTDVTNYENFQQAITTAENKFGPADCLINSAGFIKSGEFTEIDPSDQEKMVSVNLLGVINGMQTVLPGMRKRKCGTIINISSIADRKARPNLPTYAATKAAVKSLSESLRMANAKYGIRICNLAPSRTRTPMLIAANLIGDTMIEPEDIAKAILWIYEQPNTVCIRDIVVAPTQSED